MIGCPISDGCCLVLINIIFSDPTLFKDVPSLDASTLSRISVKFPYAYKNITLLFLSCVATIKELHWFSRSHMIFTLPPSDLGALLYCMGEDFCHWLSVRSHFQPYPTPRLNHTSFQIYKAYFPVIWSQNIKYLSENKTSRFLYPMRCCNTEQNYL